MLFLHIFQEFFHFTVLQDAEQTFCHMKHLDGEIEFFVGLFVPVFQLTYNFVNNKEDILFLIRYLNAELVFRMFYFCKRRFEEGSRVLIETVKIV